VLSCKEKPWDGRACAFREGELRVLKRVLNGEEPQRIKRVPRN